MTRLPKLTDPAKLQEWTGQVARVIARNAQKVTFGQVALQTSSDQTVIRDGAVRLGSRIVLTPATEAAAAVAGLFVPTREIIDGAFIIRHEQSQDTDRVFDYAVYPPAPRIAGQIVAAAEPPDVPAPPPPPIVTPPPPPPPPPPPVVAPPPPQTAIFRFGGDFAPWTVESAGIRTHPENTRVRNEIIAACPGRFNVNLDRFSPAIYNSEDADIEVTLRITETKFGGLLRTGDKVPWNEALFTAPADFDRTDVDSYTLIANRSTGVCFEFFRSTYNASTKTLSAAAGDVIQGGIRGVRGGAAGNVVTKQNGWFDARAYGIQSVVGVVLATDFEAGEIPHCIRTSYPNPTKDLKVPPATKGAGFTGGGAGRGATGYRLVWALSAGDISSWLSALGMSGATRDLLEMIAICIRDYGLIIADNGGNRQTRRGAMSVEHEVSAKWVSKGVIKSQVTFALHSLLEPNLSKMRILEEPRFIGNSSNNRACYRDVQYPTGHPCKAFLNQ